MKILDNYLSVTPMEKEPKILLKKYINPTRCLPYKEFKKMTKRRKGENNTISDVLKGFIDKNRLQKGLDKVSIQDAWNTVMGTAISKYTTAIILERDVLYIQLSSSVLREELSYGKSKIIKLINEEMGKEIITKLVLR